MEQRNLGTLFTNEKDLSTTLCYGRDDEPWELAEIKGRESFTG